MEHEPQVLSQLPEHPTQTRGTGAERVVVGGLVARELDLDSDQLLRYPQSDFGEDFACREGWTVPDQAWHGVLVGTLLDAAGCAADGTWVEFAAGDFRFSMPIDEARTALIALELNGTPLSAAHGGPARLVVPGADCFTSIKWLDRVEVRADAGSDVARSVALRRIGLMD